jgi:hypothetical protein
MKATSTVANIARRSTGGVDGGSGGDGSGSQGTPAGDEQDVDPLPLDSVFELLKNQRRRHTLRFLRNAEGSVTLSDLAEHVAALENDTTPRELSSDQRKRAYVGLYQCHLPKMDELDAVEFNRDRGLIELGPNAAQLQPYLETDEDDSRTESWPTYYLGFAATAAVFLGFAALFGYRYGLTADVVAVLSVVGFSGLAFVHRRSVVRETSE